MADPARSEKTAPFFADENFFAVRDLARLALGRVAHEQYRFDDSRYYYYLVPEDSERLAEALYESATGRYEKKDYEGARELLDQLAALGAHHRYEDEAWILSAYIDLARCHFEEADAQLKGFVAKYEPVRDLAKKLTKDERGLARLLDSAPSTDARSSSGTTSEDAARAVVALVRIDAGYGTVTQAAGAARSPDRGAAWQHGPARRSEPHPGNDRRGAPQLRRFSGSKTRPVVSRARAPKRTAFEGSSKSSSTHARLPARSPKCGGSSTPSSRGCVPRPRETRCRAARRVNGGSIFLASCEAIALPRANCMRPREAARGKLLEARSGLAKDAANRLVLRLSRLLRRARLGRIESVLGRKRALEVEVEALAVGILPKAALDSLEAARYLKDSEEYWPFEGDDWPDEYVGGEGLR